MPSLNEILKTPFWVVLWLYIMLILLLCWVFERDSYHELVRN